VSALQVEELKTGGARVERVPLASLAWEFGKLGLTSFGGGLPAHIRRVCVRERGWLTEESFLEALALAQVLPGPNVVNLSIYIGRKLRGLAGALIATVAVVGPGLAALFLVFALYASGAELTPVTAGLRGAGAMVVGLLMVNLWQVGRRAVRGPPDVIIALATAVAILVVKLPLPLVVAAAGAIGVWLNRPRRVEG
jgi:chromate transporter